MDNQQEEWKPIPGATGYQVSSLGRVKSFRRDKAGKLLTIHIPRLVKTSKSLGTRLEISYPQVGIEWDCKGKRTSNVHRLVALAFIPNPDNLPLVNHKDGEKTNNRVDNLEWIDQSGNHSHAFKKGLRQCPVKGELQPLGKLTKEQVKQILDLKGTMPQYEIAKKFGINQSNVSRILSGKRWVDFDRENN